MVLILSLFHEICEPVFYNKVKKPDSVLLFPALEAAVSIIVKDKECNEYEDSHIVGDKAFTLII